MFTIYRKLECNIKVLKLCASNDDAIEPAKMVASAITKSFGRIPYKSIG